MKLMWIGAWLLVFASAVSLLGHANKRALFERSWQQASRVLRRQTVAELSPLSSRLTVRALNLLPVGIREKAVAKLADTVQLVIFRVLLLWHALPGFALMAVAGLAEGFAGRASQQALVKIHSPTWFSFALTGLALLPIAVLLWITARVTVEPSLVLISGFGICLFSFRNLIVHAPSQF